MNDSAERPRVLVCDPLPGDALEPLYQKGYEVDLQPKIPQERLAEVIGGYDAVLVRSGTRITAEVLQESGRLKAIGRAGVGVDNIDVAAATARGILVFNTPDGNSVSVAELTMAQILAIARHTHEANRSMHEGKWKKSELKGIEIRNKILGMLGLGRVGRAVAARAAAFEMDILGYDPVMTEEGAREMGVKLVSFEEVLRRSDFITIHVPLNNATRHLINEQTLKLCKPGVKIINAARGGIVDELALLNALNQDPVAEAALDVFENEPLGTDPVSEKIRSNTQILLTPHVGGSTEEAEEQVAVEAALGVIDVLEGRLPKGAVNQKISPEAYRHLVPYLPVAESIATLALWLSEGQKIQRIETHFLGEISRVDDLSPLRAAIIRGLVTPVSDQQTVNLINYKEIEKQRGLHVSEYRQDTNGIYTSSVRVALVHEGGVTSVAGVDAHGPRVVEINDYPVEFAVGGKQILVCSNVDQPGMVNKVTSLIGQNIDDMSLRRHPTGRTAMMVFSLDAALDVDKINAIRNTEGILAAAQYKI